jgi:hypothetical protein
MKQGQNVGPGTDLLSQTQRLLGGIDWFNVVRWDLVFELCLALLIQMELPAFATDYKNHFHAE